MLSPIGVLVGQEDTHIPSEVKTSSVQRPTDSNKPKYIYRIKGFEFVVNKEKEWKLEGVNPSWIQSIDIFHCEEKLEKYNVAVGEKVAIVTLKDKYWRKLNKRLRKELEQEKKN